MLYCIVTYLVYHISFEQQVSDFLMFLIMFQVAPVAPLYLHHLEILPYLVELLKGPTAFLATSRACPTKSCNQWQGKPYTKYGTWNTFYDYIVCNQNGVSSINCKGNNFKASKNTLNLGIHGGLQNSNQVELTMKTVFSIIVSKNVIVIRGYNCNFELECCRSD